MVAGGGLSAVLGDRALELPVVALGLCWAALGLRLVRQAPVRPPTGNRPWTTAGGRP